MFIFIKTHHTGRIQIYNYKVVFVAFLCAKPHFHSVLNTVVATGAMKPLGKCEVKTE
jgi:hypothetical protein